MRLRKILSTLVCLALVFSCIPLTPIAASPGSTIDFIADSAGSAYVQASSANTVMRFSSTTDNNIMYKIMIGQNSNRFGYIRFDLTALDTERFDIDDMAFNMWYRRSHDPMTLTFTECEDTLSTGKK